MQQRGKLFDDLSQLMTNAMGVAQGAKDEFETAVNSWFDRWIAERNLVSRDEFDAVRLMAQKAREENESLRAGLAQLEAAVAEATEATGPGLGANGGGRRRSAEGIAPTRKRRKEGGKSMDWLGELLKDRFRQAKPDGRGDEFDVTGFQEFLVANGVVLEGDFAEIPNVRRPGWQGRFRMTGRLKLEPEVLRRGTLIWPGAGDQGEDLEVRAPTEFLLSMMAKYPSVTVQWDPEERQAGERAAD